MKFECQPCNRLAPWLWYFSIVTSYDPKLDQSDGNDKMDEQSQSDSNPEPQLY